MLPKAVLRLATYNIRNVRALDWDSFWFRRRGRLAEVMRGIEVDVWALQEAYPSQRRYLAAKAFGPGWTMVGNGRNRCGGGESCAIAVRTDRFKIVDARTRWYGSTSDVAGSKLPGAGFPRTAEIVTVEARESSQRLVIANTHLDEKSSERRRASLEQLVGWLAREFADLPTIVLGDLNCDSGSPVLEPLLKAGLRPLLDEADGATSNTFDDSPGRQIDHVFVSEGLGGSARVQRDEPPGSDHWPVISEISAETT